jgi:hypothetical protein
MKQAAGFLLGVSLDPEDGGVTFRRIAGGLVLDCTALLFKYVAVRTPNPK